MSGFRFCGHVMTCAQYDGVALFDEAAGQVYRVPGVAVDDLERHLESSGSDDELVRQLRGLALVEPDEPAVVRERASKSRYEDHLDGFAALFPSVEVLVALPERAVVTADEVLQVFRDRGYYAAMKKLTGLALARDWVQTSYHDCLVLADQCRLELERRGHDLGEGRCLERSFGITAGLRAAGVRAVTQVGVVRYAEDPKHEFHAWVEHDGRAIAPYAEVEGVYDIVSTI